MRFPRRDSVVPGPVYALAFVNVCIGLGYGVVAPVIPVFARDFGVSDLAASSVVSIYAFTRVLASFGASRILLRFDERTVLTVGLLLAAASSLAAAFAPTFLALLVLRAVGGIGTAMFTVSGQQLLFRYSTAESGGRTASVFQSGFLIGGVLGPVIGGAVALVSLRAPFLTHAITLIVGVAVVWLAFRSSDRKDAAAGVEHDLSTRPEQMSLLDALRHPGFRAAISSNFANGWIGNGVRFTLVPLFVATVIGGSPFVSGLVLVVGAIVQIVVVKPAGILVDRWGRRPMLAAGSALILFGIVLLAVFPTLLVLVFTMILWGVGGTFAMVSSAATVGDVLHGRGGTPIAVYQVTFDVGTMLGPLVAGAVAAQASYSLAFTASVPVAALAVLLALRPWRTNGTATPDSKVVVTDESATSASSIRSLPTKEQREHRSRNEERCQHRSPSAGSPTISSRTGRARGQEPAERTGQTDLSLSTSCASSSERESTS
ncbi:MULTISPECIES: MFS transporter [Nocardiaceae]|jgi:MFS family permease|uniref:MFS transporter n=1 Tax=Nocardiaceae TaxID=85025 RepID=UPI000689D88F|nr:MULTISPECIES: MFS transporter [Rhodococcus]OZF06383.1 MFS transporter [Rhodococcus sp. 15-1189-1-1a]OZF21152.1 MFS transporter [Rhodococcus sp. 14-2686-1-2]OZF57651.1 MFS transporter [Rhodococcus sp. 14-2470-1b]